MYAGQVISALQNSATEIEGAHLRDLLGDAERCEAMTCECEGLFMDYSRQRVDKNTMDLLFKLASCTGVEEKRAAMLSGQKINRTEGRAVMHAALRAPRDQVGLHMMSVRARTYFSRVCLPARAGSSIDLSLSLLPWFCAAWKCVLSVDYTFLHKHIVCPG